MASSIAESTFACGFAWLARVWGSVASVLMMIFGIFNITSCMAWGLYMMCIGFFVLLIEGSCVASMFGAKEFANQISSLLKFSHKAAIYLLVSMVPLIMCFDLRTLLGAGALFSVGGVYFVLAIGGKGAGEEMIVKATRGEDKEMQVQLMADTDDAPHVPTKQPHTTSESKPEQPVKAEPSVAPQPVLTGTLPADIPAAFPDGFGERTVPFTGAVPKMATPQPVVSAPAGVNTPSSSAMGPRTIPFTGPLKPVPAITPVPPPPSSFKPY